jgi:phosphopantetheine--protein transferase-like protein
MPVVYIKKEGDNDIGLWEITESADELQKDLIIDDEGKEQLLKISHEGRKKHWLAYRLLLKTMLGFDYTLKYSDTGKPYIVDFSGCISVSHSGKYAAVIIGEKPVGIDVEKISPRILKVIERFMSSDEITSVNEVESPDKYYVYWSGKEALHKLYGDQMFEFNKELIIQDFIFADNGFVNVHVENENICENRIINYKKIEDYILAWL